MKFKTIKGRVKKLTDKGWGILDSDREIFCVHYVDEGEIVEAEFIDEREGKKFFLPTLIIKSSKFRRKPFCKYYGECGGCNLMHLSYERQVEIKKGFLMNELEKEDSNLRIENEFIGEEFNYRIRAKLKGIKNGKIGYIKKGRNEVMEISGCYLFHPKINEFIKKWNALEGMPFSEEIYVFFNENDEKLYVHLSREVNVERIKKFFPKHTVFSSGKNLNVFKVSYGRYKVFYSASLFFQSNRFLNEKLLKILEEEVPEGNGKKALELFSGVGFLTGVLLRKGYSVVSVEESGIALELLKRSYPEVKIVRDDAYRFKIFPFYSLILVDPPRRGLGERLSYSIIGANPETIAYFSCNFRSFLEDAMRFIKAGYKMKKTYFFELFPQTPYFEIFSIFVRK